MKASEARRGLRVVGAGLLLGLSCVIFGVFWAVYMTVYHEDIHMELSLAERASIEEKFIFSAGGGHEGHAAGQGSWPSHDDGGHASHGHHGTEPENGRGLPDNQKGAAIHHESSDMRAAHGRLSRGHVHAMGLGALTISVSLMLAFLPVRPWLRGLAAASLGTGSFFYPLSLIITGLRTTALGEAGAAQSVFPMTALSVFLAGAGLLMAAASLIAWLFRGDDRGL